MKHLINKKYLLERFEGKGGWTFARIPDMPKASKTKIGSVKVRGTIDGFEIRKYHLMSMGDKKYFLPVKAEIRKKIKKEAGDKVHIILYPDNEPLEIPDELLLCLQDEPAAKKFFDSLSESEQKYYVQWIYSAKREETKIDRMARTINRLLKRLKLYDQQHEGTD